MKTYIALLVFSIVLLFSAVKATAQESTLLHFMRQSPQSMRSNPANFLDTAKLFFGIPLFSNINADINFGFAYSDWISRNAKNDSLYLNHNILGKLDQSSYVGIDVNYELISFGIRFREDNMITFSLAAKAFGTFKFPKDLIRFVLNGNGDGGTLAAETDVNGSAYMEAAVGYTRRIDDNWKVGARVKYLAGVSNAYGKDMHVTVETDPDDYTLKLRSEALLKTSLIDKDPFANSGVGLDAGVYYKTPIQGLDVSLSLIDWGFITWTSDLRHYKSEVKNGEYVFQGITDIDGDNFNSIVDTLKDVLDFRKLDNPESYSSTLPGKIFFGLSYEISQYDKIGFLFSTRALHDFQRTTYSLMYSRQVGNWFTVAAGNNFMTTGLFNPSLGVHFRLGNFQLQMVAENISSFYVKDMKAVNIQFGMNITIY
jgi:hypothetical protein